MARLDEIFDLQMGKTPSRSNADYWTDGQYDWVSIADLGTYKKYVEDTKEKISASAVQESGIKSVPANTVIMSFKLSLGKTAITQEPVYTNEAIMAFIPTGKYTVLPDYFYYLLSAKDWTKGTNRAVMGATLNKATLGAVSVTVPPLNEQRKIVMILDKVSDLLAKHHQQLDKLDELVKSRFIELFGDPEINPYGWEQVTVEDVCTSIVRGPFGSALKKEFFVEPDQTTYKVYEQKHAIQKSAVIGTYYVSAEKYNELRRFECHPGDILMSCSGTMGELYQLPPDSEKGIINQALCKFTLNSRMLPIAFLAYMKETIGNLETKGSGIQNIAAVSYVKAMPINLPPMTVQNQFAAFVEQTDKSKYRQEKCIRFFQCLEKNIRQEWL